jgi:hypothetical protein
MTRKDFVLIAEVIKNLAPDSGIPDIACHWRDIVAERFADRLAGTNERFDRDRFMRACLK